MLPVSRYGLGRTYYDIGGVDDGLVALSQSTSSEALN